MLLLLPHLSELFDLAHERVSRSLGLPMLSAKRFIRLLIFSQIDLVLLLEGLSGHIIVLIDVKEANLERNCSLLISLEYFKHTHSLYDLFLEHV